MKTVYFVRHGESESNAGFQTYQGEASKLTERGREQAQVIAARCAKLPVDALIVSSAVRAKETAEVIARAIKKAPIIESLFTERKSPRQLIGKSRSDPGARALERKWLDSCFQDDVRVGTGENFTDLKSRGTQALEYLQNRPESNLLVVSHGFFLHVIAALVLLGGTLTAEEFGRFGRQIWTDNTGLFLLEYREEPFITVHQTAYSGWILRVWNDHAHLG